MRIFYKNLRVIAVAISALFGLTTPLVTHAAGPAAVNLYSAGDFVILAKTGISNTGPTSIVGNIGVSPIVATAVTGFGLTMDVSNAFSTSALLTGKVYAADYAVPTPSTMTTAISDMQTAYSDAAGRTLPTATELGAGNIGGLTITPGLYKWGTSVIVPSNVTLSGGENDVWIFQIAQTLTLSSGVHITLSGGAQARNIFWVVGGQTTIGTTAVFNGNILGQTAIVLNTGAQLNGRALAQTAVTLDSNAVTAPSAASPTPTPTPTPTIAPTPTPTPTPATTNNVPTNNNVQNNNSTVVTTPEPTPTIAHTVVTTPTANTFGQAVRTIAINLGFGSKNSSVATLQEFLISQNKGLAARALAKAGATSYFGPLTRAALAEFQANAGISPAWGNFGPITRAYLSGYTY